MPDEKGMGVLGTIFFGLLVALGWVETYVNGFLGAQFGGYLLGAAYALVAYGVLRKMDFKGVIGIGKFAIGLGVALVAVSKFGINLGFAPALPFGIGFGLLILVYAGVIK